MENNSSNGPGTRPHLCPPPFPRLTPGKPPQVHPQASSFPTPGRRPPNSPQTSLWDPPRRPRPSRGFFSALPKAEELLQLLEGRFQAARRVRSAWGAWSRWPGVSSSSLGGVLPLEYVGLNCGAFLWWNCRFTFHWGPFGWHELHLVSIG